MARLLTVPISSTGVYWSDAYAPSVEQLQALAAALSGTNAAINQAAETFPVEYPSMQAVLGFVESGGVYVDYCGWPMFWSPSPNGSWGPSPQLFGQFLTAMGADNFYCDGFDIGGYDCSGYPRDRGWLTRYNIASPAGLIYGCPLSKASCSVNGETVYGAVAVRPANGTGIYFYGAAGSDNAVDPGQFANFILTVIQTWQSSGMPQPSPSPTPSPTPQQQCQSEGNVWYDNQCLTPAEYQCILNDGTWVNGVCQLPTAGVVPPAQTGPNWPLIIGGGLVGVGLIVGLVALAAGGE